MPFTIEYVPDTNIICTRVSRLFSAADASQLMQRYSALLASLRHPPGKFGLLIDMTVSPIQPADLVRAMLDFLHETGNNPARIAFVHGQNAAKMQARRVSAELGGEYFATETDAVIWLTEDGTANDR